MTRSPSEELSDLLNKGVLFQTRKQFGMHGQVQFQVTDVTPQLITVSISTRKGLKGSALAMDVRNAMLNFLQDMLPCSRFRALYSNEALGVSDTEYELPFFEGGETGVLESSQILIEENAGPARKAYRVRVEALWKSL